MRLKQFIKKLIFEYSKKDDVLPITILNQIKEKLKLKQLTRIGSGRYGTAFKIGNNKVLKITTDLKEYEYAKKIEGKKNEHIADVYNVYHFTHDNSKYAIIIKELCDVNEGWFNRMIDSFAEYTGNEMSLSYISSEFLHNDVSKSEFTNYFKKYKKNGGIYDADQWYDMIMELKSNKIYVKDFNGANVGNKSNGKLCILELGLGWWENIKFVPSDEIKINN